jgi:hypothetical protein
MYFEIIHPWESEYKPDFRFGLTFGF